MFWFSGPKACRILVPRLGIEPAPSASEGEVLSTAPPGKSHAGLLKMKAQGKLQLHQRQLCNGTSALTRGPLWTSWDFFDASNIHEVQSGAKANI